MPMPYTSVADNRIAASAMALCNRPCRALLCAKHVSEAGAEMAEISSSMGVLGVDRLIDDVDFSSAKPAIRWNFCALLNQRRDL